MKKLKKRFIVPAVVFILGMCALIGAIYVVGESQEQQNRTNAKLNAMTYTERIYGELMEGIGVIPPPESFLMRRAAFFARFPTFCSKLWFLCSRTRT